MSLAALQATSIVASETGVPVGSWLALVIAPGAVGAEVSMPQKPSSVTPEAQLPALSQARTWTYQAPSPSVVEKVPVPALSTASIEVSAEPDGLPSITTE